MAIRINLLAESQAAEEMRRRDPVKRAAVVAACLVVMVLVWVSSLQVKIYADTARLNNLETRLRSRTNDYYQVLSNKKKLGEVNDKLVALNHLSAERTLQATLLDSLMHATVDGIQITRLRSEQAFDVLAEVRPIKGGIGGRPASSVEKSKLILDARDTSANPGNDQINKFKDTLAHMPYFQARQISVNNILLKNLSTPQLDSESGKPYVLFTLECLYPEKVR